MNQNLKIKIFSSSNAEFIEMTALSESLLHFGYEIQFVNLDAEGLLPVDEARRLSVQRQLWLNSTMGRVYRSNPFLTSIIRFVLFPYFKVLPIYKTWKLYDNFYQGQFKSFSEKKCDVVILPDNVVGPIWPLITKVCRKLDISILIFPFTVCNQEEPRQNLRNYAEFQTKNNFFMGRYFKKWRFKTDEIDILRLPFPHILMHYLFRVVPKDPWHYLSGEVDVIAVDSSFTRDYFLSSGIDKATMKVLGSQIQDRIWRLKKEKVSRKQKFIKENNLDPSKPIFLISGCPNQFGSTTVKCEFDSMKSLTISLSNSLENLYKKFNVIIRPHPNYLAFSEYFDPNFFTVSETPTYELIPLSDCYLAFASATIRWALFAKVPVINYDVFGYEFSEYQNQIGVEHVKSAKELKSVIETIVEHDAYLDEKVEMLTGSDSIWGIEGGKNLKRISKTIQSCVNSSI